MKTSEMNQGIDDVLTTALESGIYYWSGNGRYMVKVSDSFPDGATYASECVSRGVAIEIPEVDDQTGDVTWHTLTRGKMVKGIIAAAKHWRQSVEAFIEDHDADSADVAVQYALFGEIIYG